MRIRPITLIAATAAVIATAGGVATAASSTPTPTPTATPAAQGQPSAAPTPAPSAATGGGSSVTSAPATPAASGVISTKTVPIEAGAVARILASCLGSEASQYHAVIAVRAPVAAQETDGVVVAVNSAKQYVQCESKGDKGRSMSVPATFINDRLWGAGHLIEFFDSFSTRAGEGQVLSVGAGHYTSEVAKVTVSFGDDRTQYPVVMADGAFAYTAAVPAGSTDPKSFPASPYVHAFDANGKEIYNQKTQPNTKNTHP